MTFRCRPSLLFAPLFILCCCSPVLAAQRVVMVEELTSQTCGPCYESNPSINATIDSYGDQVVSVRWHVYWPTPGDDWFYLINSAVVQNRVGTVYAAPAHAAPSLYIDGGPVTLDGTNERQQIDTRLLIPSPISISGTAVTRASTVGVSVDVNVEIPTMALPGSTNRIFVALIEKHVHSGATYTGTITAGSPIVTDLSGTKYLLKGSIVCGVSGLPTCPQPQSSAPARIMTIDSPTQITLTKNADQSGTRTLNFMSYNWETLHHDVFRTINNNDTPTATGDPIDLSALGAQHFDFSLPYGPQPYPADWDPEEFAVVVWVQNIGAAGNGTEIYQAAELTPTIVLGVEPQPSSLSLLGLNWPNPFTRGTLIPFSIERAGNVDLAVYDVSGRLVSRLVRGERAPGSYTARWDGRDILGNRASNGIYCYRLRTGGVDVTRRMVLMH